MSPRQNLGWRRRPQSRASIKRRMCVIAAAAAAAAAAVMVVPSTTNNNNAPPFLPVADAWRIPLSRRRERQQQPPLSGRENGSSSSSSSTSSSIPPHKDDGNNNSVRRQRQDSNQKDATRPSSTTDSASPLTQHANNGSSNIDVAVVSTSLDTSWYQDPLGYLYQSGVEFLQLFQPNDGSSSSSSPWVSAAEDMASSGTRTVEAASSTTTSFIAHLQNMQKQLRDDPLRFLATQLVAILTYKPPVGFVALYVLTQLVTTRRLFMLFPDERPPQNSVEAVLQKQQPQQRTFQGISFCLDADDVAYQRFGGIQSVRQKLCAAALRPYYKQQQRQQKEAEVKRRIQQQQQTRDKQTGPNSSNSNNNKRREENEMVAPDSVSADSPIDSLTHTQQELLANVFLALNIASKPGRRGDYVKEMIQPIARIQALTLRQDHEDRNMGLYHLGLASPPSVSSSISKRKKKRQQTNDDEVESLRRILQISIACLHLRTMDALLRICRDRLLRTTYRLARAVEYWSRRVERFEAWPETVQIASMLEGDRLRLAYAKAAFTAEVRRLGVLAQLLQQRPGDVPEQTLVTALQVTAQKASSRQVNTKNTLTNGVEERIDSVHSKRAARRNRQRAQKRQRRRIKAIQDAVRAPWRLVRSTLLRRQLPPDEPPVVLHPTWTQRLRQRLPKLPPLSKYSIHWRPTGSVFSIRKLESDGNIHGPAAVDALLRPSLSSRDDSPTGRNDEWLHEAQAWTEQGKALVCDMLRESLLGSSSGGGFDEAEFAGLQQLWLQGRPWCGGPRVTTGAQEKEQSIDVDTEEIASDWMRILQYAQSLALWRRVGEGRAVRLRDAAIISWTRQLNVFGLPLAGLQITMAHFVHVWIKPYWPKLTAQATHAFFKTMEILKERLWIPLVGIYNEIMHQGKGLMTGFGLQLEEHSLDHMLRDLGFGDGTPSSRESALEAAATQYEKDLNEGLLFNFASGRLVRLLLVQCQQIKVGLLQALDTINALMRGNQIHFQILAVIPALLIAVLGTKLFVRGIYSIRAKDPRPANVAHKEMAIYLNELECLILKPSLQRRRDKANGSRPDGEILPFPNERFGEALLYVHRYLILLEFTSWSIPARDRDEIHRSLRQLLSAMLNMESATISKREAEKEISDSERISSAPFPASSLTTSLQWIRLVKDRHDRLKQFF